MTISAGTRLGPYEIIAPAGAGGMGEVYKARDTRLDRIVAIKALPAHVADNADLRQRFDREAKAISSLNHPNICVLHDVGHQDGVDFLVMEYLEGETLAERLKRGPLSEEECFQWAIQIGDALSVAHQRGLIHRDLKPGNVIITKEGAKLLDFGLAKLLTPSGNVDALTRTTPLTGTGQIVGTLHYMSPEQLEGGESDMRSDIFSFGAMLYEMATGQRAFDGKSQASLIAAILEREPRPISELKPTSPPAFDRLLKKCLAKNPSSRWQSARDMVDELRWVATGGSQIGVAPVISRRRRVREWVGWVLAGVCLSAALLSYTVFHKTAQPSTLRAIIPPPENAFYLFEGDNAGPPVISPSGEMVAFVAVSPGGARLWVRRVSDLSARQLAGTEFANFPFWSPDGKSLGFFAGNKLKRVDIATGQVFSVCTITGSGRGGSWSKKDVILFSPDYQSDLYSVPAAGGAPRQVTHRDSTLHTTHRWAYFLPDGEHFLYFAGSHLLPDSQQNGIWCGSIDGKENHFVATSLSDAVYASGLLLYVRDSVLFAQSFNPATGEISGKPTATKDRVQVDRTTWKANFSISEDETLIYQLVGARAGSQAQIIDRKGNLIETIGKQGNHDNMYLARDGRSLVMRSQELPYGDVYYHDLDRKGRRRMTFDPFDKICPVLSPHGDQVAYAADTGPQKTNKYEIRSMLINGTGRERTIASDSALDLWPFDWSMDGMYMLCGAGEAIQAGAASMRLIPLTADGVVTPLALGPGLASSARFSPDGKWIAFGFALEGVEQVFVIPFPTIATTAAPSTSTSNDLDASRRWQISTTGGYQPRWRGDSQELYYIRNDGAAVAVSVTPNGSEFRVGEEVELFNIVFSPVGGVWEPMPDGQSFAVLLPAGEGSTPIVIAQNWKADLNR